MTWWRPPPQFDLHVAFPSVCCVLLRGEAQCAGWGDDWFPAKVRELLPNNEVQVLWEGDEPSISNVAMNMVRHRRKGDVATPTVPETAAPAPQPVPPAPPVQSVQPPQPPQPVQPMQPSEPSRKRPAEAPLPQALPAKRAEVEGPLLEFSLRPGMEFSEAFANLRRRLELELREGRKVSVRLRVMRPPPPEPPTPAPGVPPGAPPGAPPVAPPETPPAAPPGPPDAPPDVPEAIRPSKPKDKPVPAAPREGAMPNFPSGCGPRMPQKGWWRPGYGGYGKGNGFRAPGWT
ncbi:ttn-1 [Symbiodinium pilosum]|uniref:Ttn-1 protein n=1 Tax=Symbiodinium pilosum TaxID=2952 RepID=A0A812NWF6_SYMPI|nr:ttn-1 [Symbiodinium pilosum]